MIPHQHRGETDDALHCFACRAYDRLTRHRAPEYTPTIGEMEDAQLDLIIFLAETTRRPATGRHTAE